MNEAHRIRYVLQKINEAKVRFKMDSGVPTGVVSSKYGNIRVEIPSEDTVDFSAGYSKEEIAPITVDGKQYLVLVTLYLSDRKWEVSIDKVYEFKPKLNHRAPITGKIKDTIIKELVKVATRLKKEQPEVFNTGKLYDLKMKVQFAEEALERARSQVRTEEKNLEKARKELRDAEGK